MILRLGFRVLGLWFGILGSKQIILDESPRIGDRDCVNVTSHGNANQSDGGQVSIPPTTTILKLP